MRANGRDGVASALALQVSHNVLDAEAIPAGPLLQRTKGRKDFVATGIHVIPLLGLVAAHKYTIASREVQAIGVAICRAVRLPSSMKGIASR
jgi:hypothetical protein